MTINANAFDNKDLTMDLFYNLRCKSISSKSSLIKEKESELSSLKQTISQLTGLDYRTVTALAEGSIPYSEEDLTHLFDKEYYTLKRCVEFYKEGKSEIIPYHFFEDPEFAKLTHLARIPDNFLEGNKSIESFTILPGIKYIGNNAFKNCINLKIEYLPKSISYVGNSAFEGCLNITNITFSDSLKFLGSKAFKDCKNLIAVNGLENISCIKSKTFENCFRLTSIELAKYVYIEKSAFKNCSKLVCIDSCFIGVDKNAFKNCVNLNAAYLITNNYSDKSFTGCTNLKNIKFVHKKKNSNNALCFQIN